jgi:hypothetical protein
VAAVSTTRPDVIGLLIYRDLVPCAPDDPLCPDPGMHGAINGQPVGWALPLPVPCTMCGAPVYDVEVTAFDLRDAPDPGERHPRTGRRVRAVMERVELTALDRLMLGVTELEALNDHVHARIEHAS